MGKSYICKVCKEQFPYYPDLRNHYVTMHTKEYGKIKAWLGPGVVEIEPSDYWHRLAKKLEKDENEKGGG